MPASRRSVLAAAGVALTSFDVAATGTNETIEELIKLSEESNATLMRGDIEKYQDLISLTDDFTLMAPFGGKPTRRADISEERMQAMGRFFKNGTLEQEVIAAYGSSDIVVLALIERAHVEVGGLPPQPWALRVTLVYRREASGWRLAHRHADPLVGGITLAQAAALANPT
jgi:ketosteroid isomerase-like protein